jgi:signal transduction histidine kinase
MLNRREHDFEGRPAIIHVRTAGGHRVLILIDADHAFSETDRELVEVFCGRLALAFDNALLQDELREANAGLERRVAERTAELARANQRLAAQRASLRRSNSFKSEMLGTVAHDLKNPLGVILGRTEILQDLLAFDPVPADRMRYQLQHIRDCARRLTFMVDDLITNAMNDALDIAIRREPLDIAGLAGEVVAANRPLAERKGQTVRFTGVPSLTLGGDQERLREAIENLVGNAIKYSPVGGTIEVSVAREGDEAVCAVRDEGPGLSPEDIGRVFGRFQRLSAKPTGGESSTGLGLSIVKRIAELHSGQARACSPGPGCGAVFSIHLPIDRAAVE